MNNVILTQEQTEALEELKGLSLKIEEADTPEKIDVDKALELELRLYKELGKTFMREWEQNI